LRERVESLPNYTERKGKFLNTFSSQPNIHISHFFLSFHISLELEVEVLILIILRKVGSVVNVFDMCMNFIK